MPAATSAPKVSSRIPSVTGNESAPAFSRSLPNWSLIALLALPSPNSAMVNCGFALAAFASVASIGVTLSAASSTSPRMSNSTSAE